MEERRFDDLARSLGRSTSRRQVLKGLIGGLVASVVGAGGAEARWAGGGNSVGRACSSAALKTCLDEAKAQHDALGATCKTTDGPQPFGQFCGFFASLWYQRAVSKCQQEQCPSGQSCVNDHCCSGSGCCKEGEVPCRFGNTAEGGGLCCPAGSQCCGDSCCTPDKTCCLDLDYGLFHASAEQVCSDLKTDPKNCGACKHDCDGLPCIDGTCQCPPGDSVCSGPVNQTCCHPNERCAINPLIFTVQCDPVCNDCETYDPKTGSCQPTDCGEGAVCCKNSCMAACSPGFSRDPSTCECTRDGGGSGGCPPCQTLGANGCEPDSNTDGQNCGACGQCSSGFCKPDPNRTCPTCKTCSSDGACVSVENNTGCGSNAVCCDGECVSGSSCGPCPQQTHQCPADTNGLQPCCPGGADCCVDDAGSAYCGPPGGGCGCPEGQHPCAVPGGGHQCCVDGLPCCYSNGQFSYCGSEGLICCPIGHTACGSVCCDDASQQCLIADNAAEYCCPSGSGGVRNNGECCPSDHSSCGDNCCDDAAGEWCLVEAGICCQAGQSQCGLQCCD